MKVTYYGHACFAVESGQAKLLFDPFIRHNPLAGHVSVDEIQATHILVSHAHGDHLAEVEEIAKVLAYINIESNFLTFVTLSTLKVYILYY